MISIKKMLMLGTAALASLQLAGTAEAATYNFDLQYLGGGSYSFAPGSDVPSGTTLNVGDSFSYSLTAGSGMQWRVTADGYYALLDALIAYSNETRTGDYSVDYSKFGVSQYASSGSSSSCCAHIGPNNTALTTGLSFDKIALDYTLTGSTGGTYLPNDLFFFGAPENYPLGHIAYEEATPLPGGGAVPEPATWAMMIAGFGMVGYALRRRVARVGYAA